MITVFASMVFLIFFPMHYQSHPKAEGVEYMWVLTIWPLTLAAVLFVFSMKHPVYFYDKYITYRKSKEESSVDFSKIKSISISRRATFCKMKFYNEQNEVKSIRWYLTGGISVPYPSDELDEMERRIGEVKPGFKIERLYMGPWWSK